MSVFQDEYRVILDRVRSLERQNQIIKFLLLSFMVIFIVVGCTQPKITNAQESVSNLANTDVLELKQLIFKDDSENIRIKIDTTDSSNIMQSFYDVDGTERAQISIDDKGGARFRLFDTAGSSRFSAVTFSDKDEQAPNRASVAVIGVGNDNTSDNGGVFLSTEGDGTASSLVFGKNGALQVASVALPDGTAANEIFDSNEVLRFNQVVQANGNLGQGMFDASGLLRHSFNILEEGEKVANQLTIDTNKKVRFSNFTSASSSGQVNYDASGNKKTSTVVGADNSFSFYVEKTATEQILDTADGILTIIDIGRMLSGGN